MYKVDILEKNEFNIQKIGEKFLYNTDLCESLTSWGKRDLTGSKFKKNIQLSSSLNPGFVNEVRVAENFIAYLDVKSNSVESNNINVGLYSVARSNRGGFSLIDKNFIKGCVIFSARKLIETTWENSKDEYFPPNESHPNYSHFYNDSLIYSIFNSASNQSSLRQVEYKEQLWDIKNEFFWMSVEKMKELADQNGYDELYNDARTSSDRYIHKLLFGEERIYDKLSPDAKAVLDKATELVERSMELRQIMANDENHLNSWDAGYAQLKLVWKEYFQEDFKEFRQLYKTLEDRMRPLVYELGFLKK